MEILVIESNEALRAAVSARLTADGYSPIAVETGTDALRLLDSPRFESVLLDWQLSDMAGVSVLREMRTCIADLTVDTNRHVATRGGKKLLLSAKECAILELFAQHAGDTLSREEIEQHVSPEGTDSAVIPVYIHYLRKKVDDGFSVKLLRTVRKQGYVLTGTQ